MISRLLKPPRLRTAEEGGELRRATWMELFYDLVFVVAAPLEPWRQGQWVKIRITDPGGLLRAQDGGDGA